MSGRRILVVEDDPVARCALEATFRRSGWRVVAVATLAEAVANLDPAPHGIVLDLILPDGDGETILRKVQERGLPTLVAIITGCENRTRLHAAADLMPVALLCKPLDLAEVSRVFR
jgi:DNA-binding response OmpR family regulator